MAENVLELRSLTKRYGNNVAVNRADLSIAQGEIYGLVGLNGAGKTTIIRMISAQTIPTAGEIVLFGATGERALSRMRARTGVMVETPSFYPYLSALDNLEYYRLQRGIPGKHVAEEALESVGLANTGKKKFKHFSLGMKQRLGLGLALMNRPDLLLLDEPINGLDPEGVAEFRQILRTLNRERQTTILISSHILSELANVATRYGFMEQGKILEEISAEALHDKCRICLRLEVDDAARAAAILQTQLGTDKFEVLSGNAIQLYDCLDDPKRASYALAQNGVALLAMEQKGADLEAYFLNLIGGGRHA